MFAAVTACTTARAVEFLLESMVGLENVDVGQYPFECGSSFGAELVQLCRGEVRASPKDIHLLLAINGTLSASLVFGTTKVYPRLNRCR